MKYIQVNEDEPTVPMDIPPDWGGQSYYPISSFYKKHFGEKVYKISVSTAQTCPNRKKNNGVGCIFCDEWGSAGSHVMAEMPLREQIQINREKLHKRFKVDKFLVYFQSFTNTFTRLSKLKADIEIALSEDRVAGVVLGTRPDCLPPEIFPLLKDFNEHSFVSIELGVQSFLDERLDFLKRGHTAKQSLEAINQLHEQAGVNVGIHLIFGLPDETEKEIIQAAEITNSYPVDNVKLHNLHVLAKTPLESLYNSGSFVPVELEEYAQKTISFLEHLSPDIAVQRLAAVAPRWDELIAPQWTRDRLRPTQFIIKQMKNQNTCQGKKYSTPV